MSAVLGEQNSGGWKEEEAVLAGGFSPSSASCHGGGVGGGWGGVVLPATRWGLGLGLGQVGGGGRRPHKRGTKSGSSPACRSPALGVSRTAVA